MAIATVRTTVQMTVEPRPPLILRLDVTGRPQRWIAWPRAVILGCRQMIAWDAGETRLTFTGGVNRITGERSQVSVSSIIAVRGRERGADSRKLVPPLSNRELFQRDARMCMYCGARCPETLLTRDHLIPLSRGGQNTWSNVVAACRPCNHAKGARTPEEAGMSLLAVPYVPNRAEYLVLSNRRILADQMGFLRQRFSRRARFIEGT